MLKRDRLKAMLRKITDTQFNAIWKETYGYVPFGDRADLVTDFVAEQYDEDWTAYQTCRVVFEGRLKAQGQSMARSPLMPLPRAGFPSWT